MYRIKIICTGSETADHFDELVEQFRSNEYTVEVDLDRAGNGSIWLETDSPRDAFLVLLSMADAQIAD